MIRGLAADGWRYVVDCTHGCGRTCIASVGHVSTAACAACLRVAHGADPDYRGAGERGVAWPRESGYSTGAVSLRKTRVIFSCEAGPDSREKLPDGVRELAERVGGRILLSVARRGDSPTTAAGKASANWGKSDTYVSVQWRRPGSCTVRACWKNGQPDGGMIGERRATRTEVGRHE